MAALLVTFCVFVMLLAAIVLVSVEFAKTVEPTDDLTSTVIVHDPLAGIVPPDRLTGRNPAVAEILPAPQVVEAFVGDATTSPVGSVSVRAALVKTRLFELLTVIVKVEILSPCKFTGENTLLPVKGAGVATVRVALAGEPFDPRLDVTPPAGIVFT